MGKRLENLLSPGFLIALALLLINDHLLKSWFHNSLTGKLSDFAGLFSLTIFVFTLWPRRQKVACCAIVVFFSFWKSNSSQLLIDGWNSLDLFTIGRTVDYTDLIALSIIPFAYLYQQRMQPAFQYRYAAYAMTVVTLFAFTATSVAKDFIRYNTEYKLPHSRNIVLQRLEKLKETNVNKLDFQQTRVTDSISNISLTFNSQLCKPYQNRTILIYCYFNIADVENGSIINFTGLRCEEVCAPESPKKNRPKLDREEYKKYLQKIFEKEVIDRLRYGQPEE